MTSRDDTRVVYVNGVGTKRKASVDSDESKDGITADQRNAKSMKVGLGDAHDNGRVSLHDIHLLAKIASIVQPGADLMGICVAVGPIGARRIQQVYLTDNDAYVSCALRRLTDELAKCSMTCTYSKVHQANSAFDKCRDSVKAWMQYNDWKSRCTESNLKRYKKHKMPRFHETNFPFNCLNFAVELGLLEVTRYIVEDRVISANNGPSSWDRLLFGFHPQGVVTFSTVQIAIVRGDVAMIDYLLNTRMHDDESILCALRFALDNEVNCDLFGFLTCHPMMIVDDTILLKAVVALEHTLFARQDVDTINRCMKRLSLLLNLAKSRSMKACEFPFALKKAKEYLSKAPTPTRRRIWDEVMQKIAISLPVE